MSDSDSGDEQLEHYDYAGHPTLLMVRTSATDMRDIEFALVVVVAALKDAGFRVLPHVRARVDGGKVIMMDIA